VIYLAVFLASLIFNIVLMKIAYPLKLLDHPTNRKNHRNSIPFTGGLAVTFSLLVFGFKEPILMLSIPMLLLGLLDDIRGISYKLKFTFQTLWAVVVLLTLKPTLRIFGMDLPDIVSWILFIFWYVTMVNAFNLVDGIDGLAGSVAFFSFLTFKEGLYPSALAGFLIYNLPPAKVFLGDSGALFIGSLLSLISLKMMNFDLAYATIFLGLPAYEVSTTFFRRVLKHRNPFLPDRNHTHHVFQNRFGTWKALSILISYSLVCNLLGLTEKFYALFLYLALSFVILLLKTRFQSGYGNFNL